MRERSLKAPHRWKAELFGDLSHQPEQKHDAAKAHELLEREWRFRRQGRTTHEREQEDEHQRRHIEKTKRKKNETTSEWFVGGLMWSCRNGVEKRKTLRLTVASLTAARSGHEETPQNHLGHSPHLSEDRRGRANCSALSASAHPFSTGTFAYDQDIFFGASRETVFSEPSPRRPRSVCMRKGLLEGVF